MTNRTQQRIIRGAAETMFDATPFRETIGSLDDQSDQYQRLTAALSVSALIGGLNEARQDKQAIEIMVIEFQKHNSPIKGMKAAIEKLQGILTTSCAIDEFELILGNAVMTDYAIRESMRIEVDRGRDSECDAWYDITCFGKSITASYHPEYGYGLYLSSTSIYGELADEVYLDVNEAVNRVYELLKEMNPNGK